MVNLKTYLSTNVTPAQLADKSAVPPWCFGWLLMFVSPLALGFILMFHMKCFRHIAVLSIHTRAHVRNAMVDSLHHRRGHRERIRTR